MLTDDFHKHVDRLLLEGNIGLARAPKVRQGGAGLSVGAPPPPDPASEGGSYEVALRPFQKAAVLAGMRATGADKGFDRTIGRMTNGAFTPPEIRNLENRVLDEADWNEMKALTGIGEGPPVDLTPQQKAVVDGLMGRLGDDALAHRARAAYGRAVNAGQVRTR